MRTRRGKSRTPNRCPAVRRLATLPSVLDAVAELTEGVPVPFQTLSFRVGTEQPLHADRAHFNAAPIGHVLGVWVALEPVSSTAGPLCWVPGSHRWPRLDLAPFRNAEGFDNRGYERAVENAVADREGTVVEEPAAAGDVIVWTADLLHGGAPIVDRASTRRSQVTHVMVGGNTVINPRAADATVARPRVLRVFQHRGRKRFLDQRVFIAQHTGHQPRHGFHHHHRGDLSTGEHVVADRYLFVHAQRADGVPSTPS